MPNTQSAKKRLRQSEVRRLRNRGVRSNMRGAVRRVREAVAAGEHEKAQSEFRLACKKLDQAAARNVIHRNAAARTKSRLAAAVKKVAQAA
ncbi:30S ribosomal protein S20 [Allorhodopirellula heiligendammensis]|uniref:Small ribosomal subunit protein bS20 n=1 Tax=Allorhodopirellula heiligendammensis TaxID=2714739 RepID=A0A5C6BFN7_9BACT|nr:30S ribosomal protein S20 [Allorhodopirellula heiligendammensis]TWU11005.1 30S ribosomal protein S20 [Allorhodopirellula heiligendammensis]